jgi:hypothetical protein
LNLLNLQQTFAFLIAKLIIYAYAHGYRLTLGEGYDDDGVGHMKGSLHYSRLAQDLNLFHDGEFCKDSEDYKELGEYWEGLSDIGYTCCWGGRFKNADGCHFSVAYANKK